MTFCCGSPRYTRYSRYTCSSRYTRYSCYTNYTSYKRNTRFALRPLHLFSVVGNFLLNKAFQPVN